MLKKLLVSAFLGLSVWALPAQDVHFTQFTMSPLMLNPANTGAFFGSYRIGGIYRDQWAHLSNSFQTPALYVDAPIIRGFRKNDWVGVGVNFFQDKAGIAGLQFSGLQMSAAYHLSLDKKRKSVLTFGFGGGSMNRRINLNSDKIKLYDELEDQTGTVISQDRMNVQEKTDYIDLHGGLLFTQKLKSGKALHIGIALNHLNKPDYKLSGGNGDADRLPMRLSGSADIEFALNDKWSLTPAILVQNMTNIQEIQAQALAGYLFHAEKQITLLGGLGYRLGDAIPVIVGAQWKTFRVGVSWDYNTSDVTPNGNGGFEIAASYIGRIFKKPSVKRVIICPRY